MYTKNYEVNEQMLIAAIKYAKLHIYERNAK